MTNPNVSAQAEAVVTRNRVFLAGEILALTDTGIMLSTTNKGRNEQEYTERHPIVVDPAVVTKAGFDVGSRIQLYGTIRAMENKVQRVHAYPTTLAKAASEADANICEMAGIIGTTAYTPADPIIRKQGFARSFVNTAAAGQPSRNVRVVMFQDMARIWEKVPPGSEVVVGGRIRNRERSGYVDAQGDLAIFTEVIADPTKSRVIKKAVVTDAFAGVDFAKLESEGELHPAPTPAPEAEAPKANKGKAKKAQAAAAAVAGDEILF